MERPLPVTASAQAKWVLVLGLLSLSGFLPFALAALYFSWRELLAIARGHAPVAGRQWVRFGQSLAGTGVVIGVVALLVLTQFSTRAH